MTWKIAEQSYQPSLQAIEFRLTDGTTDVVFLMPFMAVADYFRVAHAREQIESAFAVNEKRIAEFAARTISSCPTHSNGSKLLTLAFCRKMVL